MALDSTYHLIVKALHPMPSKLASLGECIPSSAKRTIITGE